MTLRVRNLVFIALLALIAAGSAFWLLDARHGHGRRHGPPPHLVETRNWKDHLHLHEAAALVGARYRGRMLRAEYVMPTPAERALGVRAALSIRWITPERAVLSIRLDARSGRFLEIAGAGQIAARIPPKDGELKP